jgi:hypothetical protein
MKKIITSIVVMTLCLFLVFLSLDSTPVNANGGTSTPIGTTSTQIEDEDEIVIKRGLIISWNIRNLLLNESKNNK